MGGRKQLNVYGDKHRVLAPIIQNSEYFNLSRSDMVHVLLSHALVLWNRLPQDYREEYESINRDFELHTRSFYNVESLDITSKVGQPIGQ